MAQLVARLSADLRKPAFWLACAEASGKHREGRAVAERHLGPADQFNLERWQRLNRWLQSTFSLVKTNTCESQSIMAVMGQFKERLTDESHG
ncbi:hypothetical protein [Paracoccus aminovorans]|uniref:hypothetical protein n=1 Tax=Paracoccus aminovorans TaxID=34004 RepID=UPI0012E39AD3|nr:hypothetical protein [Paracoccus aminovorans]